MSTPESVTDATYDEIQTLDGVRVAGEWNLACLSSFTGPVWVYVNSHGAVVPLSSTLGALRKAES